MGRTGENFKIKIEKILKKEKDFLDLLLSSNDIKNIDTDWKKYFVFLFFVDLFLLTDSFIISLKNKAYHVDKIIARVLIERFIAFQYVVRGRNKDRFGNLVLESFKEDKKFFGKILGALNNKSIEEMPKAINKKEIKNHISLIDKDIKNITTQIKNLKKFDKDDLVTKNKNIPHYFRVVSYPFLSGYIHGSFRSLESILKNDKDKRLFIKEYETGEESLVTVLYINKYIFSKTKKIFTI